MLNNFLLLISVLISTAGVPSASALVTPSGIRPPTALHVIQDIGRPSTFLDNDEPDDGDNEDRPKPMGRGRQRWENLNPKIKKRLIEKGQARAIAKKQKNEPKSVKKRRE